MPTFSVPSGCRQAMTDLHQAHSERFNKVVDKLKQMKVNQKEDHKLVAAFMDTHNVLRGALNTAMKHTENAPEPVQHKLQAAAIHADDVHSSLVRGHRGAGVGRASVAGKPVGGKMAGRKVDPQTHLLKTIDDIRERYPQKPTGPR
jgi:hypothetical protein